MTTALADDTLHPFAKIDSISLEKLSLNCETQFDGVYTKGGKRAKEKLFRHLPKISALDLRIEKIGA